MSKLKNVHDIFAVSENDKRKLFMYLEPAGLIYSEVGTAFEAPKRALN